MRALKKILIVILPFILISESRSHGITEPQHGGIVKVVGDVSLELVNNDNHVKVYILDDVATDTSGMSGKLKVENDEGKNQYSLTPIKDSGLEALGVSIPSGSKVLAIIVKADGYSKIAGKFQIE
ncbi:MAG: hypothetical protein P8H52_06010 [Porticoccaceae bacterium]|nr:hypothetical protein [Porticoccaceae bacterium]